jgi:hypothetical protein
MQHPQFRVLRLSLPPCVQKHLAIAPTPTRRLKCFQDMRDADQGYTGGSHFDRIRSYFDLSDRIIIALTRP